MLKTKTLYVISKSCLQALAFFIQRDFYCCPCAMCLSVCLRVFRACLYATTVVLAWSDSENFQDCVIVPLCYETFCVLCSSIVSVAMPCGYLG